MMTRLWWSLVIWLTAISGMAADPRPNIVFIFSDDHALEAISSYGGTRFQTPQIDRLAAEGALFRRSYCGNSICGPSRASILTGLHSHKNGFRRNGDRFDGSQDTFPKRLQAAGYQTAIVGKWHLETDPTGFDHWEVLPGQGHYYNPDFIQMDGSRTRYTGYCTDLVTDLSIQWLEQQRDPSRPFLLMIQHKAPHRNWAPAVRHLDLFKGRDLLEPATLFDDYAGRTRLLQENEMSIRDHFYWAHDMKFHGENLFPDHFLSGIANSEYQRMNAEQRAAWDAHYEPENRAFVEQMGAGVLSGGDIVRWKYQRYIKDYLACIAAVDENVGRVLDHLDASGLADRTVVIYSSDQGFYLGEHGWYDKRWMFEESLSMPFLIRWPGVVPPGARPDALIQNIDYAPTFLELAGLPVPAGIQGRSLVPILRTGRTPADWRDAIYYAYYENAAVHNVPEHDGVRTDRYKLMHFPRTREWQLFDLERDPQELQSVHADPGYAPILAGLQKRHRDLRRFYDVNSAIIPATRGDEAWWRERDQAKREELRAGAPTLAFIGDSITQGWEGAGKEVWERHFARRNAVNLGFSGDRTEHVLWRLTRSHPQAFRPKVAVLMIGTNNTGHQMQDPIEVAQGIRHILDVLEENSPETRVLLLGIFPRGANPWDPGRLNNIAINQAIRRFADGDRIRYIDLAPAFLESDGSLSTEVMPDRLHLSPEGYRRWAEAMEPALRELGI
jgi:arylsulfatase A-like enzyme/lysophospholipase L1-like esterase